MKSFKNYLAIIILLSILILPTLVFASWWNPFTWNWSILNIFKKATYTQTINEKISPNESNAKKNNININPKKDIKNQSGILSKIIFPNGGEVLEIGKTYQIKWKTGEYPKDSEVRISWINRNGRGDGLAVVTNTGIYDWEISSKMDMLNNVLKQSMAGKVTDEDFKIKIFVDGGGPGKVYISENYFKVKGCVSLWKCSSWNSCGIDGTQNRNCIDNNDCGLKTNTPSFSQKCK